MMRMSSTPASRSRAPASRPPKPPPIDDDFDVVGQRRAGEARLDIGIVEIVRELALDLAILLVAVGAQALVALGEIFFLQRIGIKAELVLGGFLARFCCLRHRLFFSLRY